MPDITIEHVTCVYPSKKRKIPPVTALDDLSLFLRSDLFHVVVGYSGCGKTTLLRCIAGLQDYDGDIFFDGEDTYGLDLRDRNIAFVSQQYTLYPLRSDGFRRKGIPLTTKDGITGISLDTAKLPNGPVCYFELEGR